MKNIVVLYDIENLIGGYNLKYLSEISLKNILQVFYKNGYSNIAVQKAYADWSNSKLNEIKWDIAELGIEPIQMYGFSKGAVKNASDIQLVIDAMEILHTKPFIDTFVLVSGDGGFSSLAKKISEYGKKVIGCSFRDRANLIFTKVCDEFIFIDDTLTQKQLEKLQNVSLDDNKKKAIIESPVLKDVLPLIEPVAEENSKNLDEIKAKVEEFVKILKDNSEGKKALTTTGLNISVFKSALNYLVRDFDTLPLGFVRLVNFLRYVLKDTSLKLIHKEPSEYRIIMQSLSLSDFVDVDYVDEKPNLHSSEFYKRILEHKLPLIKIPENIEHFHQIVDYLLDNRENYTNIYFQDLIDNLVDELGLENKEIVQIIYFLIHTKNLLGDNSNTSIKEQFYYFSPLTYNEILSNIEENGKKKILSSLDGTINQEEFDKILEIFK